MTLISLVVPPTGKKLPPLFQNVGGTKFFSAHESRFVLPTFKTVAPPLFVATSSDLLHDILRVSPSDSSVFGATRPRPKITLLQVEPVSPTSPEQTRILRPNDRQNSEIVSPLPTSNALLLFKVGLITLKSS